MKDEFNGHFVVKEQRCSTYVPNCKMDSVLYYKHPKMKEKIPNIVI